MLAKIDEVLDPLNPAGDSPRDGIFELDRPAIGHILPPADMDLSLHVLSASCAEFELELEEEQDEDGEERYAPSGRISPCTFLAWTQDCKLWDHDEIKVPTEEVSHLPPYCAMPTLTRMMFRMPSECDLPLPSSMTPLQPSPGLSANPLGYTYSVMQSMARRFHRTIPFLLVLPLSTRPRASKKTE